MAHSRRIHPNGLPAFCNAMEHSRTRSHRAVCAVFRSIAPLSEKPGSPSHPFRTKRDAARSSTSCEPTRQRLRSVSLNCFESPVMTRTVS